MSGGGFELLEPKGLWLASLLAPLVVLYILKVRRERRRISSTWLWASTRRDLVARSPFKRLVAEVPLLLEALAILLFAFALARPATRGRGFSGDHVAIVIDTSASMSAEAGTPSEPVTRIELAKRAAEDLTSALGPGSDVLVLEAGREARLAAPLDRDLSRVRAAIEKLTARDVEGDLGAAVALALDRMRQLGGARRIVVFTDGALAHPEGLTGSSDLPVEIVTVGRPIDNAAIVRVDVRSGPEAVTGKEEVQGFLVVANFGKTARDLFVTMRESNTTDILASRRLLVQPGERQPVVLTFHPTRGDYDKGLVFEISPHDYMPVDDTAYGKVPAGDKLPVFLAGASPSTWIERALLADPMVELRKGTVGDLAADRSLAAGALVVVDGACPTNAPGGDLLVVHPPVGRCGSATVGAEAPQAAITSWESGDARFRFLTLDGVHLQRPNILAAEGASQELVRTRSGAIAVDASTPARTVTVLGFDVGESDWPLKASFVLFMRNVLEDARSHRAHGVTGPAHAGEPMRATVPPDARDVKATGPNGEPVDVSMRGGLAIVPDVPRVGLYQITWQGDLPGSVLVPANLTSSAESDVARPLPVGDGTALKVAKAVDARPDAHTEWGFLLAFAALALLLADVAYLTRTPRSLSPIAMSRPKAPERRRA